jgi:hypothetical protein
MHRTPAALLAALIATPVASAQLTSVYNPSFEIAGLSESEPDGYRLFTAPARVRVGVDPGAIARTGIASMRLSGTGTFVGFDTNVLTGLPPNQVLNDLVYDYGCGPVRFSFWYAIPADAPLQSQRLGIKMEFRRSLSNTSIYLPFEALPVGPELDGVGHTNGEWRQISLVIEPSEFDFIHNYNNQGMTYGQTPQLVSLLPFRFGDVPDSGVIYIDDMEYSQDLTGAEFPIVELWDDTEIRLDVIPTFPGIVEPAVPVTFMGDSTVFGGNVGYGCTPSGDTFQLINIVDRVPSTTEFPQTFADIIANNYIRPVIQQADGTSDDFGSSVVSAPGYRQAGGQLNIVPTGIDAHVQCDYDFPALMDDGMGGMVPAEPPKRTPVEITGTGDYGAAATVESTRTYIPDPVVGTTQFKVDWTFTANQNINLDTSKSTGNDAFRLIWISSMFSSRSLGEFDGSWVEVIDGSDNSEVLLLQDSTPRNAFLWSSPRPTAVGKSFTVGKEPGATWNPTSPSVTITIDALTGVTGNIGVQGFLDSSLDVNDDSLSVWLEWTDAPATITSGTVLSGSFTVTATEPSSPSQGGACCFGCFDDNLNGPDVADFQLCRDDVTALECEIAEGKFAGVGTSCAGATCDAYCQGDLIGDGNGNVTLADFSGLANNFGLVSGGSRAQGDFNCDGAVSLADFTVLAQNFGCVGAIGHPND